VIRALAELDPPVPRLLAAIEPRVSVPQGRTTLVVGAGCDPGQLDSSLAKLPEARLLVMSALGAHPDARAPRLRALWDLEERARRAGRPVLTLRLGPIVGPASPLWLRLRSRPSLPESPDLLLNPVIESDVLATLERALEDRAPWEGWFEVAGIEVFSLGELASLAARSPRLPAQAGSWEPPHRELREHRLTEAGPWSRHFDIAPITLSREVSAWP
jgi:uncharacterized protein YbjT (DUF2867 family)